MYCKREGWMPDWMSSSDGYTRATCYSCAYDRKELFPLLFHYRAVQFTHASSRRLYWPRPKARLAVASNVSRTIIQVHGRKNRQSSRECHSRLSVSRFTASPVQVFLRFAYHRAGTVSWPALIERPRHVLHRAVGCSLMDMVCFDADLGIGSCRPLR
jgi:hypothetical protein